MQEMLARSMVETTYGAAGGLNGANGANGANGTSWATGARYVAGMGAREAYDDPNDHDFASRDIYGFDNENLDDGYEDGFELPAAANGLRLSGLANNGSTDFADDMRSRELAFRYLQDSALFPPEPLNVAGISYAPGAGNGHLSTLGTAAGAGVFYDTNGVLNINVTTRAQPADGYRAIGAAEGFFTFDPRGQAIKGFFNSAVELVPNLLNAVKEVGLGFHDAAAYAGLRTTPDFQPSGAIAQSIQQNGALTSAGRGLTGLVTNAPGIGTINALYRKDYQRVGGTVFEAGLVGGAGVVRGIARYSDVVSGGGRVAANNVGRYGRFGSADELGAEAFARYQRYTDEAYAATLQAEECGRLVIPEGMARETIIGQRTDAIARSRMERWLGSEGISEGAGQTVQLNRWFRDPSGSGSYRIPDVRIPDANLIMDGTIGLKWQTTPQVADFYKFSGGSRITIVRPTELGGSYSLLPPR
jgi:hypothetical protein